MEHRRHGRNSSPGQRPYSHDRDRRPATSRASGEGRTDGRRARSNNPDSTGSRGSGVGRYGRPAKPGGRTDSRQQANGRFDPKFNRGKKRLHKPATTDEPQIKITSEDQITDGKFRGRHLKNSDSPRMTHTDRKLREILFKIIARRVKGRRFLDLGCGCGMIGIEAISRGTMISTFVERSPRMCGFVRTNLSELGIKNGHGEVTELEAVPFLKRAARSKRVWDLVFLGTRSTDENTMDYLRRGVPIETGGLLIIEHPTAEEFPEKLGNLSRWRLVSSDDRSLTIYERK